jgi:hypothetical protein
MDQARKLVGTTTGNVAVLVGDMREDLDPELIELVTLEMRDIADAMAEKRETGGVLVLYDNDPAFTENLAGLPRESMVLQQFDYETMRAYLESFDREL